MVMPACISAVTPYAVNTPYVIGDIVSMYFFGGYLDNSGIIFFECFYPGTTGPNDPTTTPAYSMNIMRGEIIPDASFNPGGEPAWKVLGSLQITLNGQGTQIPASGGYPASPQILGPLSSIFEFDGTVNSRLLENYSDVSSFISDPASWNITYQSINTANPAAYTAIDVPPWCPIWTFIALATAYINCGDGYNLLAAGVWATFLMPYTLPPPAPRGTITLLKQTAPAGSVESFTITPSWKDPVTLTDGQSDTSDVAAGTYSATETIPAGWFLSTNIDPSAIVVGEGDHITLIFLNSLVPPIPARVLPYLKIPSGQGQSVQELDGQSSISTLDIECIDPSNELKLLANKPSLVGRMAYFKMGFENMKLSDFVPLHTVQIADVGRTPEGWVRFSCRDNLALLDRALWYCGGPQPVALPWLYGQRYEAGQYVQDSNGNIQQCIVAGITSRTQPPTWPGTIAPVWQPNTSYTLGYWAIDNVQGNLQQVTTVPAGSSPTRPLNTGVSGDGFPNPSWSAVVGGITTDNSGGNPNGPLSWTCIAINNVLGEQVTDGTVTWQLVAFPYRGAFGGSQAFYVYNLFGQTVQVPEPPPRTAFTSNQFPTVDGNPRYIYGNPLDALLVALQNELGLGQNPLLPPIVTTDPNDPQNALVFAPNPAWQQYAPGDDSTLINPNPFVRIANVLSLRDNEVSGRKFEWIIKRPVTAKSWIQEEILKPLGLYMYTHADGSIDLKSMKSPASTTPFVIDDNTTKGTPDQTRIPVVNVVTTRGDVDDLGAYSAARVYDAEMTFVQKESLAIYKQEFANSIESNGMREAYDSYGVGFLLADRIFRRHGFATPQYDLKVFLGAVRLELGDYILLSNKLMLDYKSTTGRVGLFRVLCEIVDRQPDYANAAISLKVLDTRFMQETTPYLIAPLASAIPDWPTATTAQRKKYMFIAYWPGWYSNGVDGNGIF